MPSPNTPSPPSRRPLWLLLGFALLLIAGFVSFLLLYDIPAPDDADMRPAKAPRKQAQDQGGADTNALGQFLQVVKANPFDSDLTVARPGAPTSSAAPSAARSTLNRQVVLDAFEVLMRSDPSTWVWSAEFTGFPGDQSADELGCIVPVSTLLRTHAGSVSNSSPEEAVRRYLGLAKFSGALADSGGVLIHHSIATIILRGTVRSLERPLVLTPASSSQLAAVQKELEALELSPATFAETLRGEYQFALRFDEAVRRGEPVPEIESPSDAAGYPKFLQPLFYKPHLTLALRLEHDRAVIHGLSLGWKEALNAHRLSQNRLQAVIDSPLKFWINPNTTGISQWMEYCKGVDHTLATTITQVAIHRQSILQLALRRYELDHHQLPQNLAALTPVYLSSIPPDPFTGLPMRWNPFTHTLYTVGPDLVDQGGRFAVPGSWSEADPGQYYWWSEAAARARDAERLGPTELDRRTVAPSAE